MKKRSLSVTLLTRTALLAALAVALSALENIFTPLLPPGVHPGFGNIAVMFAAAEMGLPWAMTIAVIKSLFALATRGGVAFLMSFAGGCASCLVMWALFRFASARFGLLGISMAGAFTHNLLQLAVSFLLFGKAILAYAPLLLLLAVPCGAVTGALLRVSLHILRKTYHIWKKDKRNG